MSEADSLFGSPPPSPARGRSPSLALPEHPDTQPSVAQNVGTIALPGSHDRSSEPPVIDPALPSGNTNVPRLRPPALPAPARVPPASRPTRAPSRPARVPSRRPEPAPSHTAHTDRTLRDLVGLISHFEPVATAPATRPPPIAVPPQSNEHPPGSSQNPILIDAPGPTDAVNSALVALACTAASALKLPPAHHDVPLSQPIVNNVLYYIKHDPALIPTLQATHDYLASVPTQPLRSFSHVTTNQPNPKKKRRRKYEGPQIPAGAGHWDVPFPFAPGQGPNDYPSQWHLGRGRRVLGDLLGLFERAFAKTRSHDGTVGAPPNLAKKQRTQGPNSSSASDFEGSVVGASVPPADIENAWLDHQRMSDWLSSVPGLAASSSRGPSDIPSPSPSDPAPPAIEHDLMALLAPNFFGDPSPAGGPDDQYPDFDFGDAFDGVGFDTKDDTDLCSMLGPSPSLQSINDVTAFPMGVSEPQSPAPLPPQLSHEFVIDPVLMALSQQPQPTLSVSLPPAGAPSPGVEVLATAPNALASLMGSNTSTADKEPEGPSPHPSRSSTADNFGDGRCLALPSVPGYIAQRLPRAAHSVDAPALGTMPATSVSSSQREPTPAAPRVMSPAPSTSTSTGVGAPTLGRAQRKAAVLERARAHRARLVREIESVKMQRWETVVEGGVLRNIASVGADTE